MTKYFQNIILLSLKKLEPKFFFSQSYGHLKKIPKFSRLGGGGWFQNLDGYISGTALVTNIIFSQIKSHPIVSNTCRRIFTLLSPFAGKITMFPLGGVYHPPQNLSPINLFLKNFFSGSDFWNGIY